MSATIGEPSIPAPRDTDAAYPTTHLDPRDVTAPGPYAIDAAAYVAPLTGPQNIHQLLASAPASPISAASVLAVATAGSRDPAAAAPQLGHNAPSGVAVVTEPASATAAAPLHHDGECADRFFVVDIQKQPGKSLGIKISNDPSGMIIHEVHVKDMNGDETHIREWNRACRATYPLAVVKPLDRIVRVNNVRPELRSGSDCCEQMRAQIFFQTDLLLLIARPASIR